VTWEVARFADKDAIIVHEAGSVVLHGSISTRRAGASFSSTTARTWARAWAPPRA